MSQVCRLIKGSLQEPNKTMIVKVKLKNVFVIKALIPNMSIKHRQVLLHHKREEPISFQYANAIYYGSVGGIWDVYFLDLFLMGRSATSNNVLLNYGKNEKKKPPRFFVTSIQSGW